MSIVSWALSPLGLGTIHSSAPANGSGWRPSAASTVAERGAVGGDAGDGDHRRPVLLDERHQPLAAGAQLGHRELRRPGGRSCDEVGDADATPDQVLAVGVASMPAPRSI